MKKAYKVLLLIMSLFCITSAVGAKELTVDVETPDKKGQLYTLRIYNKGVDVETASDTDIAAFDDCEAVEDGKVSFVLDFGYPSGIYKYVVKSFSGDFEKYGEIAVTNEEEYQNAVADLAESLNEPNIGESAKKVFDENKDVFLISSDFDIYDDVTALATDSTYEKIAKRITQDMTLEELKKVYRQEMMLGATEKASPSLIVKMNCEYGDDLELKNDKVNEYYNKLSGSAKTDAASKEKGKYDTLEEYSFAHAQAVAIVSINNVSSWTGIKPIINDLNEIAELGFPTDLGSSKEAEVLNSLSGELPLASVADFKAAVKRLTGSGSGSGSSSGSGSGGSGGTKKNTGGSQPGYIVPTNKTETPTESKKEYFDDISDVKWAEDAINKLASMTIISGKGENKFAPNDFITREEFVKIIVEAFDITGDGANTFGDVSEDEWFAPYVIRASAGGVTNGFDDGTFGVGKNITREDACSMIARAVGIDGECDIELEFSDIEDISDYSLNAIKNLVRIGAVNGSDGKILPQNNITRAETAVIVSAVLEVNGK